MQNPITWAREMENVNCFFHLVSLLVEKRNQPRNLILVQTEGDAVEKGIKKCPSWKAIRIDSML